VAHPRAQVLGLAYVDDPAAALPQVDAGPGGQTGQVAGLHGISLAARKTVLRAFFFG